MSAQTVSARPSSRQWWRGAAEKRRKRCHIEKSRRRQDATREKLSIRERKKRYSRVVCICEGAPWMVPDEMTHQQARRVEAEMRAEEAGSFGQCAFAFTVEGCALAASCERAPAVYCFYCNVISGYRFFRFQGKPTTNSSSSKQFLNPINLSKVL